MAVNNEFLSASFENKHSFKTGMTENYKNKMKNKIEKIKNENLIYWKEPAEGREPA